MAVFLHFAALLGVTRADASLTKAADVGDEKAKATDMGQVHLQIRNLPLGTKLDQITFDRIE